MKRLMLSVVLCGNLVAASAVAQPQQKYVAPDFISAAPVVPAGSGAQLLRLSLAEALSMAAANNLGLRLSREALHVSQLGKIVARGAFEPEVTASYGHSRADALPATSQEGGAGDVLKFTNDSWNVGASKRFTTGTRVSVNLNSSRADSNLGTAVQPLNYRASMDVGISQPLLRGFGFDLEIPKLSVLRAQIASEHSRAEFEKQMSSLIQQTEAGYWDVVEALKSYQVQKRSLEFARKQRELTERQIVAGVGAPADRIAADSTLASRELALIRAQNRVDSAWDQLRSVLNMPRAQWSQPILPTEAPSFSRSTDSLDSALAQALDHRPEVTQNRLDLRRAALRAKQANNDRLPQLDLALNYGLVGQDQAYGTALEQLGSIDAPSWSVFLSLRWTPLNRAASASADIERANERMVAAQTDQAVLSIYSEVRSAARTLASAERELFAAARFRDLAKRSLDVEQRKYLDGSSSNFLVAQRAQEVAQAELAELGSLLNHKKARVSLERATGQILRNRSIELVAPKATRSAAPRSGRGATP